MRPVQREIGDRFHCNLECFKAVPENNIQLKTSYKKDNSSPMFKNRIKKEFKKRMSAKDRLEVNNSCTKTTMKLTNMRVIAQYPTLVRSERPEGPSPRPAAPRRPYKTSPPHARRV